MSTTAQRVFNRKIAEQIKINITITVFDAIIKNKFVLELFVIII